MKQLNGYFQAQAALKEKQINEAKSYIPKILALCLKKGVNFDFNAKCSQISVYIIESSFDFYSYFTEDLVMHENGNCITLKNMYEKLKAFKCK